MYIELSKNLQAAFTVSINVYHLRKQLANRTWSGRERFEEYYQSKRIIAQKLNLPEEELVEYLVEGIEDQTLRNQARIRNFKTVNEMLQAFRSIQLDPLPRRKILKQCFICNEPGHIAANCRINQRSVVERLEKANSSRSFLKLDETHKDKTINFLEDKGKRQQNEQVKCNGLVTFRFFNSTTNLTALFDTGSPISLIRRGLVNGKEIQKHYQNRSFRGIGNGSKF